MASIVFTECRLLPERMDRSLFQRKLVVSSDLDQWASRWILPSEFLIFMPCSLIKILRYQRLRICYLVFIFGSCQKSQQQIDKHFYLKYQPLIFDSYPSSPGSFPQKSILNWTFQFSNSSWRRPIAETNINKYKYKYLKLSIKWRVTCSGLMYASVPIHVRVIVISMPSS